MSGSKTVSHRARLLLALALTPLLAALALPGAIHGQAEPQEPESLGRGTLVELRAGEPNEFRVPVPEWVQPRSESLVPTTAANITVNYSGFTPQAQAAFEFAVNIWEQSIQSSVPIVVNANWTSLGPGILGSAGAANYYRNFPNAPFTNTWFPVAIANSLAGTDLDPANPDIVSNFNSNFANWYFGIDGNTPPGMYDFVSVVLHELGHGLGFAGSVQAGVSGGCSAGAACWGAGTPYPDMYDRFVVNGLNQVLYTTIPNNTPQYLAAVTNNDVYFSGPNTNAANGGSKAPLYAPAVFSNGSSYSHLAESFNNTPNALMTWSLGSGESIHNPGPVALGVLKDSGWTLAPNAATQLAFSVQPSNGTVNVPLASQPAIQVRNASGQLVPGATNVVTLHLQPGGSPFTAEGSGSPGGLVKPERTPWGAVRPPVSGKDSLHPEFARYQPTDTYAVWLASGADPDIVAADVGARNLGEVRNVPGVWLFQFEGRSAFKDPGVRDPLERSSQVLQYEQQVLLDVGPEAVPPDPLVPTQWHLKNTGQGGRIPGVDVNVEPVWDSGRHGEGVVIGIVDDGVPGSHPDLAANYLAALSHDYFAGDPNPSPEGTDAHGTSVAGLTAARDDGSTCGVGVAYRAGIAGLRLISGSISDVQMAGALGHAQQSIHIYNNSWGPVGFSHQPMPLGTLAMGEIIDGATTGRGGLGNVYLFSGGNDRLGFGVNPGQGDAGLRWGSTRFGVEVAALIGDDNFAPYSNPGASLFVSAPGGTSSGDIATTDRQGSAGYSSGDCMPGFNGTSAATPIAAGVVALMLQANPNLTLRDVQHILATTSVKNDPTDPEWQTNGAGIPVSRNYGFGRINAQAAVNAALTWPGVPAQQVISSGVLPVNQAIPDNNPAGVVRTFNVTSNVKVEHVEVVLNVQHNWRGDVTVTLTSPSGTTVKLAVERSADSGANYTNWTFTTPHFWKENSAGTWTLKLADEEQAISGTWVDWRLNVYGTAQQVLAANLTCDQTVGGVTAVAAVGGVAAFSGCTIDQPGTYTLVATAAGLTGATSQSFVVAAATAAPVLTMMTPNSARAGGPGTWQVSVFGTGFEPNAQVKWNGATRPTTFVSSTEVRFTLAPADYASAGTQQVRVVNPGPSPDSNMLELVVAGDSFADVDCSGTVDGADGVQLVLQLAGLFVPSGPCLGAGGDADRNGVVDLDDVLHVLRVVEGVLPE